MSADPKEISSAFATARKLGRSLPEFPGMLPLTLNDAYAIQDLEIAAGAEPLGWKVAAIKPELRERLGASRLAGPIMQLIDIANAAAGTIEVPVVQGGFSAVEAEFACRIGRDIPIAANAYTEDELLEYVASMHVASEIAGSPLATLSELGPTAVISDHGNNAAVVIGAEIAGWRERALEKLAARTEINGTTVGEGSAAKLPTGGPLGSLAFLVENLGMRGRHLKAGDWVATGATTGVHKTAPGDVAIIDFGTDGQLSLKITAQRNND